MQLPTIQRCCCLSLKTGVIISATLWIILSVLFLIYDMQTTNAIHKVNALVLFLLVHVSTIFGVVQNKPNYLLPSLILVAVMIFVMLIIPIGIVLYYGVVGKRDREHDDGTFKLVTYINLFTVFWLIAMVVSFFWIVEYSLYKSILTMGLKRKDDENPENFELII